MDNLKPNTLWYNKDVDTYLFVLYMSTDENYVFAIWLGNGDTTFIHKNKLGEFIESFKDYEDAAPTINKLINNNLISGVDNKGLYDET